MEMKLLVLGMRRFNDSIEGKAYNFCKLRVAMPCPRGAENELGLSQIECNIGKADQYEAYRSKFQFPGEFLVDLEPSSKGFDVVGIRAQDSASRPVKAA